MEKASTKQRILIEALTLFSKKGYDAISVGQIADAVGIKAPSLYKHYKSKQDIFDAIIEEMGKRYKQHAASLKMDGSAAESDAGMFNDISKEQLIKIGKELFTYFLHDEYVCKFRKMLTVEQYHSEKAAALYAKQYVDDPLSYQGMLFGMLIEKGTLIQENPHITALHFYAPIYLLLTLCDRQPEKEKEALALLEEHIIQFNRIYRTGEILK